MRAIVFSILFLTFQLSFAQFQSADFFFQKQIYKSWVRTNNQKGKLTGYVSCASDSGICFIPYEMADIMGYRMPINHEKSYFIPYSSIENIKFQFDLDPADAAALKAVGTALNILSIMYSSAGVHPGNPKYKVNIRQVEIISERKLKWLYRFTLSDEK